MLKKIAISQSNYIPWKGYFDLINSVDVFVFYDVVQYTKNDWRNRNKLIINGRPTWQTIPVYHESLQQKINETFVSNLKWSSKHLRSIEQNYSKAPSFNSAFPLLECLYSSLSEEKKLSKINTKLIIEISRYLGITTEFRFAEEFILPESRVERLSTICRETGSGIYVSGPAAKSYLNQKKLGADLKLEWFKYKNPPTYKQLSSDFNPQVSIVDYLLCAHHNKKSLSNYN